MFAHGETVTVQTAGTVTDPYSADTVTAWELGDGQEWTTEPTEVDVANVLVGSGGSTEPSEAARNAVDSDFDLIFQPPITTVPTAQDRVVVRGLVCEVDGRPFAWRWAASSGDAGAIVRVSIQEG
ncbi:hypothetical protein [Nocardioides sp. URHA0032]|uniref:hypothetical protein n=1 Tax=Nocardioides sp. URHA0032 TaxID=1380388 RepID=UPI00048C239E|nr:hypothetical protein [Nocardioides sp. URHA0032]